MYELATYLGFSSIINVFLLYPSYAQSTLLFFKFLSLSVSSTAITRQSIKVHTECFLNWWLLRESQKAADVSGLVWICLQNMTVSYGAELFP